MYKKYLVSVDGHVENVHISQRAHFSLPTSSPYLLHLLYGRERRGSFRDAFGGSLEARGLILRAHATRPFRIGNYGLID